jgi:hypothetical protein
MRFYTRGIFLVIIIGLGAAAASGGADYPVRTAVSVSGAAAALTLYSFDGRGESAFWVPNLGHSFVSVKNSSGRELKLGGYILGDGDEVSVGAYGQSAHFGIWYNLECKFVKRLSVNFRKRNDKRKIKRTQGL